jgi:hypothetical protein
MYPKGLIDSRNVHLWNTLCKSCEIDIQRERRNDYSAFSINSKTIIYVPEDKSDPAFFTHELLHIYLRTKDIFIGGGFTLSIKESKILSIIFSDNLIDHVANCIDHIKMLPEFIKLGYDAEKFISDYSINKLTHEELSKIRQHFVTKRLFKKIYRAKAIELYIGKYFAVKACPNKNYKYDASLADLKLIDQDLYLILENFSTAWANFDIEDKDPITGGYHIFLYDFIDSLEKWTNGKTIK